MLSRSCCVSELNLDFELLVLDIDALERAVDNLELFRAIMKISLVLFLLTTALAGSQSWYLLATITTLACLRLNLDALIENPCNCTETAFSIGMCVQYCHRQFQNYKQVERTAKRKHLVLITQQNGRRTIVCPTLPKTDVRAWRGMNTQVQQCT